MEIVVRPDPGSLAVEAADRLQALVASAPGLVLGLAAGATPIPLYADLVRRQRLGQMDLSRIVAVQLDETLEAPPHRARFERFLEEHLLGPCGVPPSRRLVPREGLDHDAAIRAAGGLGLQLLGIGHNGHLGFNEPGTPRRSATRLVTLAPGTVIQSGFTSDRAITTGLGTILAARRVWLLATGPSKASIVAQALRGPVTEAVPASLLRDHPAATFFLDDAAAGEV